ncbi:MAG: DUF1801 domain-containing protein [Saprospiraceae bacterium]|nr:DUF1801 domain-containing protein [Saprospiraceae bacterium]
MELSQAVIERIHNIENPDNRKMVDYLMDLFGSVDYNLDCGIRSKAITFAVNQNWYHWMAAINTTKKGISIYFYKGIYLDDKFGLLEGNGKYLRTVRFNKIEDINKEQVLDLINQAIAFQLENVEE